MTTIRHALALLVVVCLSAAGTAHAASIASPNFVVTAPSESIARQVANMAEFQRKKLARLWYGHELPDWAVRCSIAVDASPDKGAGGSTSFKFSNGEVYGWQMRVQGSVERILDSVIPHEVNHTILACYFRRKVPRWADEGAATIFEHTSERQRQISEVQRLMHDGRRIPLRVLMSMTQYPSDMPQVMAMYAQSYSVTDYLIQKAGRQTFLAFLNDAHQSGWDAALKTHYEQTSIEHLEQDWTGWVMAGFPRLNLPPGQLLAGASSSEEMIVRGQSPDTAAETPEPTRAAFRALPVPSLRPAVKVATQLRSQLGHTTTAAFSRVRSLSQRLVDGPSSDEAESPRPIELTPVTAPSVPGVEDDELQPLELIPLDGMTSSRSSSSGRSSGAAPARSVDPENPFAEPNYSGLSRLSSLSPSAREATPASDLRETRLHRSAETPRPLEASADWSRFPRRLR